MLFFMGNSRDTLSIFLFFLLKYSYKICVCMFNWISQLTKVYNTTKILKEIFSRKVLMLDLFISPNGLTHYNQMFLNEICDHLGLFSCPTYVCVVELRMC